MLAKLAAAVTTLILGAAGRATRLDLDCRHHLAGWPTGLAAGEVPSLVSDCRCHFGHHCGTR